MSGNTITGGVDLGPVDVEVGVDENGDTETRFQVDLAELIALLARASKPDRDDRETLLLALLKLWEEWGDLSLGTLQRARKIGLSRPEIAELEDRLRKLRVSLREARKAVERDDDDRAEDLRDAIEDQLEELADLLEVPVGDG